MAIHRILRKQLIPVSLEEIWAFFSNAGNLAVITPPKMNFRVTSGELPQDIYPGQVITYKVSPLLGIPLFWMTEITHVVPLKLFVDEQRRGPYRLWHHQHHFEQQENGILMTDLVHYELPFYFLGEIVHQLLVYRELQAIFDYRSKQISTIFLNKTD
jgi:ligand-binding SRPBCC domain-containing protein